MADTNIISNFKRTIQQANGYEVVTATWQGDYEELRYKSLQYPIGLVIDASNSDFSETIRGTGVVTTNNLNRREGRLGDLSISVSIINWADKHWFCSLEYVAVPKDIRTWKPVGDVAPDLTIIQYWEGMKATEPQYYAQYKYREPPLAEGELGELADIPEGPTKTLAEMIFQGVNNYTIHAPCITASSYNVRYANTFAQKIDKQVYWTILKAYLESSAIGIVDWGSLIETADVWIMTDYKVTTQANGLSQMTMRWLGATDARVELYPETTI